MSTQAAEPNNDSAQQSREAIDACTMCDDYGMRRLGENTVKRCTHNGATEEAALQALAETERHREEEERQEFEANSAPRSTLTNCPTDEYQALFNEVKAEAISQYPSIARCHPRHPARHNPPLMIKRIRAEQASETIRETNPTSSNEPVNTGTDQPIG